MVSSRAVSSNGGARGLGLAAAPLIVLIVLTVLTAAATVALAAEGERVQRLAIVDEAIAFHGADLYGNSETTLEQCSASGCSTLRVLRRGSLFEYEVEGAAGGGTRRVLANNGSVRRWDDGVEAELDAEGERRSRDWVNSKVYFPFLPYGLNDGSTYKEDQGLERWGDRELRRVKVTFKADSSSSASDEYLYWFDPENGRLEQFAYSFGSGERAGVRFRRLFNYRRVGGVLFADQENLGAEAVELRVDVVTPDFVAREMRPVSTVTFREIRVRGLR